jgi:acetyl esterase/lipase
MHKIHFSAPAIKAVLLGSFVICASIIAQQRIDLYPTGAVPGARGSDTIKDVPCIYVYQPASGIRNGSGMVICPGGAYTGLSMDIEGTNEAAYFNQKGMTCFVLRYRLCSNGYTRYPIRNDGLRAMRLVRARAKQWSLDTARLGVMGFSAGGHIASMMSTQFDDGNPVAADTVERASNRPSFSVFGYTVITCTQPYAWSGLFQDGNFIGPNPSPALVDSFSSEKHITTRTPKAFLFYDEGDWGVAYQNSVMYHDSCLKKQVSATSLRLYNCNPAHGFGMSCSNWADSAAAWMTKQGIFTATSTVRHDVADGVTPFMPRGDFKLSITGAIVSYTLHDARRVSITIVDQRGRKIATVSNGIIAAGRRAAVWDAKRVPAGVYVCRASIDGMEGWAGKIVVGR